MSTQALPHPPILGYEAQLRYSPARWTTIDIARSRTEAARIAAAVYRAGADLWGQEPREARVVPVPVLPSLKPW